MNSSGSTAPRRARPVLSNPHYRSSRRGSGGSSRGLMVIGFLFIVVISGIGLAGGLYWSLHRAQGTSSRPLAFHVGSGDTVTSIADRLKRLGLVDNPLLFRLDARVRGLAGNLKVGDYTLRHNMSIDQAVAALSVYHADTISVTVPEGYRMEQTAAKLTRQGINGKQFLREAMHPTDLHFGILKDRPAGRSLEGYLFPNTYRVPPHYSGKAFARYMVATLDKNFTPQMRKRAAAEHLTVFQVLTLASIVEREARVAQERPTIASVYLNRLKIGMKLQADPTVQYSVGTPANWWPLLRTDQLQTPGPYNTYVNSGLPPGPIASPGLSSILAVLHPAPTKYLFFVAKGHGRHAFARTYAEQLANQQKYSSP